MSITELPKEWDEAARKATVAYYGNTDGIEGVKTIIRSFLSALADAGWVVVPVIPTGEMLAVGEGYTDLVLPEGAFENTKGNRMREIGIAWSKMLEVAERQLSAAQPASKEASTPS